MTRKQAEQKKKMNPIVTIIFAVILPLLVAFILAITLLTFLGIDVAGWTEDKLAKTPIISAFVQTEDEKTLTNQLNRAKDTIEEQKDRIEELEKELEDLEAQRDDLEIDLAKLENETTEEAAEALEEDEEGTEDGELKKLASSFRKMDKEQAAQIVANLNQSTAITLLELVSGDVRGEILEHMDPKVAANLMEAMAE